MEIIEQYIFSIVDSKYRGFAFKITVWRITIYDWPFNRFTLHFSINAKAGQFYTEFI